MAAVILVVVLLSGCAAVQDRAGDEPAAGQSARSATVSVSVEKRTSPAAGVPDSRRVQQCIGTAGTVGTKLSDPPIYAAAVKATTDQLDDIRSCLTGLDFVTRVEVRQTNG